MSGVDPALFGRGFSGISIGSNISDLDARAVELLLGDQVDEEHVKVRQNTLPMITYICKKRKKIIRMTT